ncbi:hypothetical protein RJ639_003553 [Escallonia herrerae]|uniref:Protein kinase domain-containing protein n=1 Tax=Escallonia herrerae TaxID=1293975 RepID=A0AA89AWR2_9ASTE|nr:hypothetical protein RJ639_003553 [Escallonia herrerae]
MTTVNFAVSQPPATDCILNVRISSSSSNSNCRDGNWGGFLNNNCCGGAFDEYLYALAQRANQTGQVFLDSTDQRNCLTTLKSEETDNMGCGIEKLTSGSGECSDFSVNEVNDRLGKELRSCKGNAFVNLLILLMDGISLVAHVRELVDVYLVCFLFLSYYENGDKGTDLCILIGGILGTSVVVIISIWILVRRSYRSNASPKEDGKRIASHPLPNIKLMPIVFYVSGKVYKGILPNDQQVAVKHIINDGCIETFLREVRSLSHVRHPNLVPLLGYSENGDECFLIYELCPNGNLSEWIFGTVFKLNMPSSSLIHLLYLLLLSSNYYIAGKDKFLNWIQRLHIATDTARGLWYLHTYPQGCIVHRDIKPTNILLGQNFEAKLSDFGLSKVIDLGVTYVSSEVRGTFGYVDPEYQNNRRVNSAGDVYSFGIVLLQILSGRKVINMNVRTPMPIDKMAKSLNRNDNIVGFADPQLDGEYSAEAFDLMFNLALSCTGLQQHRPSMAQVVSKLEEAMDISTRAKASTPLITPDWSSTPHATPDWSSTP